MMLGYADNHAKDVYRMLNLETNRVPLTRDIIWLKKMYGAWKTSDADNTSDDEIINNLELQATKARRETDDPSIDDITESFDGGDDNEDKQPPTNNPVSPRVLRAMKKLGGWFNPEAQSTISQATRDHEILTGDTSSPDTNKQSGRDIGDDIGNVLIDRFHHDFANYETAFEVADIKQAFDQVKYDKNYNEAWNHPYKFQQEKW
jgi:hypothetical protein